MGTDVELIASISSDSDDLKVEKAFDLAVREMERIEMEMSEWKDGSYVSKINRNAGRAEIEVPAELFNVIAASQKIAELSGGAFDISWAAMRGLWKFSKGEERVPSLEEIAEKLPYLNYREIKLNETKKSVFLTRQGMAIGLGGIAKGYSVDMAMDVLVKQGITDAIIKSGGDMRIQGTNDGAAWDIGIQHPRDKDKVMATLPLSNISVSTSGDYERFFIKDGVLYHHIIDPKTGMPARGCTSVTILAPDTMTSDALSTTVFVLGPEKGMQLIQGLPGVEGIIVDSNGRIHYSQGIEKKD
ncbi:MAG: FAD:protein FMN transferase [Nitrospirae bacterium]|nr:FAD:protein FMN transferase [Nitrospirota bacterium]